MRKDKWDDEKKDKLRALWAIGRSASQIADAFKCTRNAVIGQVHRMELPPHKNSTGGRPAKPRAMATAAKVEQVQRDFRFGTVQPGRKLGSQTPRPLPAPRPFNGHAVTLLELTNSTCRWPVDVGNETHFCGHAADLATGRPYCDAHTRIAFVKQPQRF